MHTNTKQAKPKNKKLKSSELQQHPTKIFSAVKKAKGRYAPSIFAPDKISLTL
jgi:hypothetical protein